MYAWRVGAWGGTIKPDDAQTVLWTAAAPATKAATATARKTRAANERDDRPRADVQRPPFQSSRICVAHQHLRSLDTLRTPLLKGLELQLDDIFPA